MCTDSTCSGSSGTGPTPSRRALLGAALAAPVAPLMLSTPPTWAGIERPRLLVFSRTTGFRHMSIETAVATITDLGAAHGFDVDATEDPTAFTHRGLDGYDAIAFVNTTGDVLEGAQRAALKRFVRRGGGWAGVHSAADTEYSNPFYTRLLAGGRFLAHPLEQPGLMVTESATHRSTRHLPEQWLIPIEEFYSFTSSVRGRSRVLLSIEESSYLQDPNTSNLPTGPENPFPTYPGVSGVMGDHPMAWTHRVGRGRSWYTALGHEITMYYDDRFTQHLLGGLVTVLKHGRKHRSRSYLTLSSADRSRR
ncbi:MAG: ThuA domain-containing protein [Actinomycetota bacterium]|nr:ThuA domain-containing protein [Actinomycetota bacterium]